MGNIRDCICSNFIPPGTLPEHIFSSIKEAMDYLRDNCIVIPEGKSVIIEVISDQNIDSKEKLSLNHPNGERITIRGNSETNPIIYYDTPVRIDYKKDWGDYIIPSTLKISGLDPIVSLDKSSINISNLELEHSIINTTQDSLNNVEIVESLISNFDADFIPNDIYGHTMAQSSATEMYIFGGYEKDANGVYHLSNKLRRYSLTTRLWYESSYVTSSGQPVITPRAYAKAAYYSNNIYVWGGVGDDVDNSMWRFNFSLQSWTKYTPGSPAPSLKHHHSMITYGTKIIIFGGYSSDTLSASNECWSFDVSLTTWSNISNAPFYCYGHTASLYNNRMFILGGMDTNENPNTSLYEFNLLTSTWTPRLTGNNVITRRFHSSSIEGSVLYNFGGHVYSGGVWNNNPNGTLFSINLSTVNSVVTLGTSPKPRSMHTSIVYFGWTYILGGYVNYTDSTSNMFGINSILTEVDYSYKNTFGCSDGATYVYILKNNSNELHRYNMGTKETSNSILARSFSNFVYTVYNSGYMYILQNGAFWRYAISSNTWLTLTACPRDITNSTMVYYNARLYIFGGADFSQTISVFTISTGTWGTISSNATTPSGRINHSALVSSSRMYIYGGENSSGNVLNDFAYFDFNTNNWTYIVGDHPPLKNHSLILIDNMFHIIGGQTTSAPSSTNNYIRRWNEVIKYWDIKAYLDTGVSDFYCYTKPYSATVDSDLFIFGGIDNNNQGRVNVLKVTFFRDFILVDGVKISNTKYLLKKIKGISGFTVRNNSNIYLNNIRGNNETRKTIGVLIGPPNPASQPTHIIYDIVCSEMMIENNSVAEFTSPEVVLDDVNVIAKNNSTVIYNKNLTHEKQFNIMHRSLLKAKSTSSHNNYTSDNSDVILEI